MKTKLLIILITLPILVVTVLASMPANIICNILNSRLECPQNIWGTIWSGHAYFDIKGDDGLSKFAWNYDEISLVNTQIKFDVLLDNVSADISINDKLAVDLELHNQIISKGMLALLDLPLTVDAVEVSSLSGLFMDNQLHKLEGEMTASNVFIDRPERISLGSVHLACATQDKIVQIRFTNNEDFKVSGTLSIDREKQIFQLFTEVDTSKLANQKVRTFIQRTARNSPGKDRYVLVYTGKLDEMAI